MGRESVGERVRRIVPFRRQEIMTGVTSMAIIYALLCHQNVEEDRQQVENAAYEAQHYYDTAVRISNKCKHFSTLALSYGDPKAARRTIILQTKLSGDLQKLDRNVADILKNDRQQTFFDDWVSLGQPAGLDQLDDKFKDTVIAAGNPEDIFYGSDRPYC